jgi:hypothetical protein
MNDSLNPAPAPAPEADAQLFDVMVSVPSGARLEDIERLARGPAGIRSDRVDSLIKMLRNIPQAKIGAGVTRDRADKAKEQFAMTGLIVTVTPVLAVTSMTAGSFDGMSVCPSCNKRVMLPANRQCPECGVFVDKVTEEALLKRRIMEQERGKIDFASAREKQELDKKTRETLEASMRAKIRAELEAKYGLNEKGGMFRGTAGLLRAGALVGVLALAFAGGKGTSGAGWLPTQWMGGSGSTKPATPADVDKMLDSVGPKDAAGAGAAAAAGAGAPGGAASNAGLDEIESDDAIMQAAHGKKFGGKGLTIEQAVAASQALAKSVGNTTAERAMADNYSTGAGAGAPSAGSGAGAGAAAAAGAGAAASVAAGAGAAPGAAASAQPAAVSSQLKLLLSFDFARQLAEMGQLPRARDMIKVLKASPKVAADPVLASAARVTEMEIKAWSMAGLRDAPLRAAADALMADAIRLPDAIERSQALSRVAVILSRHAQLPPEAARAFLTQAADAVKAVTDPATRTAAVSEWAVALGESLAAEVTARARTGQWGKAQAAAAQVEGLVRQAPEAASQLRLNALDFQVKQQLGQPAKAAASLQAALAQVDKIADLTQRAAALRAVARLAGGGAEEQMRPLLTALETQALQKGGVDRARALTQLSLLNTEAGLRAKAADLGQKARGSTGLSAEDSVTVSTDLLVRGDLATAKLLHGLGLYAESESVLRELAGYLL